MIVKRQFSRKPTKAELLRRAERRLEKGRERQRNYRERLTKRQAPELRDLAVTMLAAYLSTADAGRDTRLITVEFLARLQAAGFSPADAARRLKALRKKLSPMVQSSIDNV